MTDQSNDKRVLALDVHPRSFVFEGPNRMLDWGVRSFRTGANAVKVPASTKFLALLDEFRPSAVVIGERLTGRTAKQTRMLATIERQARSRRIPVRRVSRRDVNRAFVDLRATSTKSPQPWLSSFPPSPHGCRRVENAGRAKTTGWEFSTRRRWGLRILFDIGRRHPTRPRRFCPLIPCSASPMATLSKRFRTDNTTNSE